jgi:NTE family protein
MSKDIALVLASGGARGLAHIGAIEVLEERGYHIHSIAGSSMGAVVGGIYACGKLQEYKDWMCTLTKTDVFQLLDFTFSLGFVKSERVFSHVRKIIGDVNIEDMDITLRIIATNLEAEKEHVFDKGNMIHAMRASTAYPTIITPARHNGHFLVDGGVLNPLPLDHVQRKAGDILMAVDLGAKIPYHSPFNKDKKKMKRRDKNTAFAMAYKMYHKYFGNNSRKEEKEKWSYFKLVTETINVMHNRLNEMALHHHQPDITVPISFRAADTFEFYHAAELIEYGRQQTIRVLDEFEGRES